MIPLKIGAFHVGDPVGEGAMGQVFAGVHVATQTPVVLKFLNPEIEAQVPWATLDREIRAQAGLDHPNIVVVVDFGRVNDLEAEASEGRFVLGQAFLVMEKGQVSLERRMAQGSSWLFVKRVLLSILDGLAHAHARGVVHRDIKPANIIGFESPARWKLTDFGIAHQAGVGAEFAGTVVGTPQYMAPEQFSGRAHEFGPPTDLYALGCLAFQMVHGHTPFTDEHLLALANAHLNRPVPPWNPSFDVPAGFESWVLCLLAKSPWERFQFAADAAYRLSQLPDMESTSSSSLLIPAPSLHTLGWDEDPQTLVTAPAEILEENQSALAGPPPPCPFPGDWRRFMMSPVNPLFGLSSALFSVRRSELVARDSERDKLWNIIARTTRSHRAHICLLKAPFGRGKTVLANWFKERLLETGAAQVISVRPGQSMTSAVLEHMSLPSKKQEDKIDVIADRLGVGKDDLRRKIWKDLLSDRAQPEAVASYISALASMRTVLLWVDDLEDHDDAREVIDLLLQNQDENPRAIFILGCVDTDGLVARPTAERWVDSIEAYRDATVIFLQSLSPVEVTELVESLLVLDESAKMNVLMRAGADPTVATHLIQDWIRRGWLELQKNRVFRLNVDVSAASTIDTSWEERTRSALGMLTPTERACVLAGSVLGQNVLMDQWVALCERRGLTPHSVLVPSLVDFGLAIWTETGWSFTHPYVREAVCRASTSNDIRAWHAEAAAYLGRNRDLNSVSRVAHHLFESRQMGEAINAHDRAARLAEKSGNLLLAAQHTQVYLQLLEGYPDRESEALLARIRFSEISQRRLGYFPAEDREVIEAVLERGREKGWPDVEFKALNLLGWILTSGWDWDASTAHLEQARELAVRMNYSLYQPISRQADNAFYAGQLQTSYDFYLEALDHVEGEEDIAWCHFGVGFILALQGDHADARKHLNEAYGIYQAHGDFLKAAAVKSSLADIERYERRYDQALAIYYECLEVQNQAGRVSPTLHANIAETAFSKGEHELGIIHASKVVRILGHEAVEHKYPQILILVAIAEGDWSTYETLTNVIRSRIGKWTLPDVANAFETAAMMLERQEDLMRSFDAFGLAAELWRSASDPGRAALCEFEAQRVVMKDLA